jgi:transposase-like protein
MPQGGRELAGFTGYRESVQSWRELLVDHGLPVALELAIGDGALGFWASLSKVFGQIRTQRCWVHKRAKVLNKMPTSVCPEAGKTPKKRSTLYGKAPPHA